MSGLGLCWALAQKNLTPLEKLALIHLGDNSGSDGVSACWNADYTMLAAFCGVSEALAQQVIIDLEAKGALRADKGRYWLMLRFGTEVVL
jgi:hypothetical protein